METGEFPEKKSPVLSKFSWFLMGYQGENVNMNMDENSNIYAYLK
jgi:hypothetical protein